MDARKSLLMSAKEVFETRDVKEVAEKLRSGDWVAVNAFYNGGDIYWCLIRIL